MLHVQVWYDAIEITLQSEVYNRILHDGIWR